MKAVLITQATPWGAGCEEKTQAMEDKGPKVNEASSIDTGLNQCVENSLVSIQIWPTKVKVWHKMFQKELLTPRGYGSLIFREH